MRFGAKLRVLRARDGYTLQQLAELLGYATRGYVSDVEGGDKLPSVDFVVKTARLFQVTTDILLLDDLDLPETSEAGNQLKRDTPPPPRSAKSNTGEPSVPPDVQ